MKVISGKYKGRIIKGYDTLGTRPTMDRVKESLFGMIQDYIDGSVCLDLFAGTGALGIEALSNGSKITFFNDFNKKCTLILKNTLKEFGIDNGIVTTFTYKKALEYYKENNIKFDVIFLDPPYKFKEINEICKYIYDNDLLVKNGIIVIEINELYINIDFYNKIKEKKYNDKYILIYKNNL